MRSNVDRRGNETLQDNRVFPLAKLSRGQAYSYNIGDSAAR